MGGFAADFCATGLKYRDYYYNWNSGHRYVLNLREDETYTRYYRPLGTTSDYWVGSEKVATPDPATDVRERRRRTDSACVATAAGRSRRQSDTGRWARAAYRSIRTSRRRRGGLQPGRPGATAEVVYKVQAANAIASQNIQAQFARTDPPATATLAVSVNHGDDVDRGRRDWRDHRLGRARSTPTCAPR